jgi:hypothetical protein
MGKNRPSLTFTTNSKTRQPSTSMWVSWLRVAPLWATNTVGITSFARQRFPSAARTCMCPVGSVSSKLLIGRLEVGVNVETSGRFGVAIPTGSLHAHSTAGL